MNTKINSINDITILSRNFSIHSNCYQNSTQTHLCQTQSQLKQFQCKCQPSWKNITLKYHCHCVLWWITIADLIILSNLSKSRKLLLFLSSSNWTVQENYCFFLTHPTEPHKIVEMSEKNSSGNSSKPKGWELTEWPPRVS